MGKRRSAGKSAKGAAERILSERRQVIERGFAQRHPERVKAERALRKHNRQIAKMATAAGSHAPCEATPQTLAHAARAHQGAIARLFHAGAIDAVQLGAAHSIRMVYERLGRDVRIGSMSMETRVDQSRSGDGTFYERLGAVRAEMAYSRWRAQLARPAVVLAMVVEDRSCREVARQNGMRDSTARRYLTDALDEWGRIIGGVCREVTDADLAAAHAGILS
ncbi:hypothetical protein [Alteraurantiacibacter palmitatis]|uniref:Uncharacterized protein n=1 Tax=Alteraurantiacibacter palmitatis TaxID=2054628 RepID=A0ABV7E400_9SPHN